MGEQLLRTRLAQTQAKLQRIVDAQQKREKARVERMRADLKAKKKKFAQAIRKLSVRFLESLTKEQRRWYSESRRRTRHDTQASFEEDLRHARSSGFSEGYEAADEKWARMRDPSYGDMTR